MSSGPQADVPSPSPEPASPAELGALLRLRGAPLVEALEQHRPGAREHAEGTAAYAFAAAAELGFERSRCEAAREAAMLHEIGQVYVPASVLAKSPTARSSEEERAIEAHYEAGYRLARGAGIPEPACGWLLRARERYDGSGPERLGGDSIPIESRICRAACECAGRLAESDHPGSLDDRVSRTAAALRAAACRELDPRVVEALVSVLERSAGPARAT